MDKQALSLTLDMIQRRDDLMRLLGDDYKWRAMEARRVLRGMATNAGKPLADVALTVAKGMSAAGHDPSIVIAAFVDECEAEEAANGR